jgi:hypothetical protein
VISLVVRFLIISIVCIQVFCLQLQKTKTKDSHEKLSILEIQLDGHAEDVLEFVEIGLSRYAPQSNSYYRPDHLFFIPMIVEVHDPFLSRLDSEYFFEGRLEGKKKYTFEISQGSYYGTVRAPDPAKSILTLCCKNRIPLIKDKSDSFKGFIGHKYSSFEDKNNLDNEPLVYEKKDCESFIVYYKNSEYNSYFTPEDNNISNCPKLEIKEGYKSILKISASDHTSHYRYMWRRLFPGIFLLIPLVGTLPQTVKLQMTIEYEKIDVQ